MEINSEIDSYPEGEGALNKYYSDMLDRPDETYEIDSEDLWTMLGGRANKHFRPP